MDESYDVQLKRIPTEQEILNDQNIPEELRAVFLLDKEGDAAAQSELAIRYLSGAILPKDDYRAAYWVKLAAENGDSLAQSNYGVALQRGLGNIEINLKEAIKWFMKAAEKGEAVAQFNLGLAYARGLGVERNHQESNRLMKMSADGRYSRAQAVIDNGLIIKDY